MGAETGINTEGRVFSYGVPLKSSLDDGKELFKRDNRQKQLGYVEEAVLFLQRRDL